MYVLMRPKRDRLWTPCSARGPSGVCMLTAMPLKHGMLNVSVVPVLGAQVDQEVLLLVLSAKGPCNRARSSRACLCQKSIQGAGSCKRMLDAAVLRLVIIRSDGKVVGALNCCKLVCTSKMTGLCGLHARKMTTTQ